MHKLMQYKKEAALRTFVYYNVVLAYLFTANIWITIGIAAALELAFSACLFIRMHQRHNDNNMTVFMVIDTIIALTLVFVASFQYVLVEYVFDAAAFLGDARLLILFGFLFALQCIRYLLLFTMGEKVIVVVVALIAIPIFILFIVLLTNESFWADAHTAVVASNYVLFTMLFATLFALWISHYALILHTCLVALVLIIFWNTHSERAFSSYLVE